MAQNDDLLLRERRGTVLLATLNRPRKGNALNQPLIDALDDLADEVEQSQASTDPHRALVITGAGTKAFSAGADITELDGIGGSRAAEQMRRGQRVFDRIEQLPVVVIAAINGFALGGGLELAMAADLRIAAPSARLGQPEITLANLPGWGGTQRLPRLLGRSRATRLILTGDLITAQHAHKLGLTDEVADDPVTAAVDLAARIAAHSATAVAGAKRAIHIGLTHGYEAGLDVEADGVAACCETAEQKAAVQAFLKRRTPSGS
ncbi:enoyl-CoA hydratase/isomerase family protein [Streptomyces sp. NPDC006458]|uniref:enoyl-CoA hydratase/isomerase family protein n=1 Tax=Streptomyces sp. NPDC006458 TaxID=3154302 RepID=UPI0033A853BE